MHERSKKQTADLDVETKTKAAFDIDALLHPARAFSHPSEVVSDPDLRLNEKRAILSSWASDACAVEAAPDLRQPTHGPPIKFDEIMEALKSLDEPLKQVDYGKLIDRARRIRDLYRPDGNGDVFFG
jgi:hypothetical protein